jgi:ATP-dependent Clp protease ATP-binding subunit ClpB
VFNALLQILDDGRMTDGQGRVVDFKNTVIIMTSNVGSSYLMEPGLSHEEMRRRVLEALRVHFRPEFLNRLDEIVIFHSLSREQIRDIVQIQVERLKKLLRGRHLELELTPAAAEELAEAGYDPVYGARPLKRLIQRLIQDPLALALLEGQFHDGDQVLIDADPEGNLVFLREMAEAA